MMTTISSSDEAESHISFFSRSDCFLLKYSKTVPSSPAFVRENGSFEGKYHIHSLHLENIGHFSEICDRNRPNLSCFLPYKTIIKC